MDIEQELRARLESSFDPVELQVINESHQHNVPLNSQTHFKVVLASAAFVGKRAVQRHQQVYALAGDLFEGELHALALHLYTPDEWAETGAAPASPNCRGGEKTA